MDEVRVAVIGCGLIGRTHARMISQLGKAGKQVRLVVACDRDGDRAEAARVEHGFERAEVDAATAIASADVNAVWICTPTDAHEALLELALARGHAVFCEKPMAHTAARSRAMAEAVRRAGVPAQVGMVLRYSPLFLALRERVADSEAGRAMAVVFRDDQCLPIEGFYASQWRADVRVAGGGTVIEHSIHDLDLLAWMFGDVRSVWASASYFSGHEGIEDVASAVIRFENGLTASLISVWHRMPHRRSERRVEIFCERARFESVGDFHGSVEIERAGGAVERVSAGQPPDPSSPLPDFESSAYLFENQAFIEALLEGRAPSPGFDEAVTAHVLVDALYESARSGREIALHAVASA